MSGPRHASKGRVAVVPCSGIGKSYGSVAREAAYAVVEDLRPDRTQLVALSLLVLGDEEARSAVADNPCITVDGCQLGCAKTMVERSGGAIARAFDVLGVYRRHRHLKPQGIAELNEDGLRLARVLAEEAAAVVDGACCRAPAFLERGGEGADAPGRPEPDGPGAGGGTERPDCRGREGDGHA